MIVRAVVDQGVSRGVPGWRRKVTRYRGRRPNSLRAPTGIGGLAPLEDMLPALAVRLHPSAGGLGVDAWVALTLVDFNRPRPRNRDRPLARDQSVVTGVRTILGTRDAEGDWLLDTGAACTMISTATARRLGLVDASGTPSRRPEFTLPIGESAAGMNRCRDSISIASSSPPTVTSPASPSPSRRRRARHLHRRRRRHHGHSRRRPRHEPAAPPAPA